MSATGASGEASGSPSRTELGRTLRLTFDGRPLDARPGQTVGAALVEAGVRSWRTTRREGRPRGLFCGIGVCFDCLITADGVPNQRACLLSALDGMILISAAPAVPTPAGRSPQL